MDLRQGQEERLRERESCGEHRENEWMETESSFKEKGKARGKQGSKKKREEKKKEAGTESW